MSVLIPTEAHAVYNLNAKEIYTSPDWKNLLHYDGEKSVINRVCKRVDEDKIAIFSYPLKDIKILKQNTRQH